MNSIYSYIASYFRIIPIKTIDTLYNYYYGTRALPAIRMEKLPKIYSVLNHVTSLGLEPTEIIPGIFLGNGYNANNYSTLNYYKIKTIINVSKEIPNAFEGIFDYYRIPINDDSENHISEFIPSILEFLNNKRFLEQIILFFHLFIKII